MAKLGIEQDGRAAELFGQYELKGDPNIAIQVCQMLKQDSTLGADAGELISQVEANTDDQDKLDFAMAKLKKAMQS